MTSTWEIIFFAAFFQNLPDFFLNDSNSTLICDLGIGMLILQHWKKNVWSLVEKVDMTNLNGCKNIILNENTEGIFTEVKFCWYIVVSISNNMNGISMWITIPINSLISYKYAIWHLNT